jgi:hypothetical protein
VLRSLRVEPNFERTSFVSDKSEEADEFVAVSLFEACEHCAASVDLRGAEFFCQANSSRREFDVHDTSVTRSTPSGDQPSSLKPI